MFKNLNIGKKIGGSYILLIIALIVLAGTAYIGTNSMREASDILTTSHELTNDANRINTRVNAMILDNDPEVVTEIEEIILEIEEEAENISSYDEQEGKEVLEFTENYRQEIIKLHELLKEQNNKFNYLVTVEGEVSELLNESDLTFEEDNELLLSNLNNNILKINSYLREYLQEQDNNKINQIENKINVSLKELRNNIDGISISVDNEIEATNFSSELEVSTNSSDEETFNNLINQYINTYDNNINDLFVVSDQIEGTHNSIESTRVALIDDLELLNGSLNNDFISAQTASVNTMVTVAILGLILSIFFGIKITKSITGPVYKLKELTEAASQGDLRKSVDIDREDELGLLIGSVNQMTENIKQIIINISDHAIEVSANSEELSASSEETSAAVAELAASTDQLSSIADTVDESINNVENEVQSVEKIAKTSEAQMQNTKEEMDNIVEGSQKTIKQINILNNSVEEIEQVITLISDIASQTNMLALNAAIEAARAGSAGRGFTVVADEIRQLAEKTQKSTSQISQIIEKLNDHSEETAKIVKDNNKKVEKGKESLAELEDKFSLIVKNIYEITGNIEKITGQVEHVSESSNDISRVTEEQEQALNEITNTSIRLADMSEQLEGIVKNFNFEN